MSLVRRVMHVVADTALGRELTRQLGAPRGPLGALVARGLARDNRDTIRWVVHRLDPGPAHAVLEIGCGPGVGVAHVLDRSRAGSYDGVDPSPTVLAQARRRNRREIEAGRARFHQTGADRLPFPDDRFDAAFAINVVYFWEDPVVELTEIHRVLSPGGRFVLGIRPRDTVPDHLREHFESVGHRTFTTEDAAGAIASAGFVDVTAATAEDGYVAIRAQAPGMRPE